MSENGDGFINRTVELSGGTVHFRESGTGRPLVFVHGFGVSGSLWDGTAAALAGVHRCIVPDWPLGSHTEAMRPDADLTPPGIALLISEFLRVLDLDDVIIIGNDSGGAVSQILVTEHPERIGGLVLTNCDCFEKFPPGHFRAMARLLKIPGASAVLAHSLRLRFNRRSPLSYGALTERPLDDSILRSWTEPQFRDRGVRRDGVSFFTGADTRDTMRAAEKLRDLEIPALLVWGTADRFFTIEDARRLAGLIPDSTLVEVAGGKTFLPIDRPAEVAGAISRFLVRESATA